MNEFVVKDKDGKPVFIGREDPKNPPVRSPGEGSKMTCPICGDKVEWLLGEDTEDGGKQGCKSCYIPSKKGIKYDPAKEKTEAVIFD